MIRQDVPGPREDATTPEGWWPAANRPTNAGSSNSDAWARREIRAQGAVGPAARADCSDGRDADCPTGNRGPRLATRAASGAVSALRKMKLPELWRFG